MRGFLPTTLVLTLLSLAPPLSRAADGYMATVTADPGKIMASDKVLAEVPRGMSLWIFNEKPGWHEVKIPNGEEHGWIAAGELTKLSLNAEQQQTHAQAIQAYGQYKKTPANRPQERRQHLAQAAEFQRRVYGNEHPNVAFTLAELGKLIHEQDDYAAAKPYLREAYDIRSKVLGRDHELTAIVAYKLAALADDEGDYAAAATYYEQALRTFRRIAPKGKQVSALLMNLANIQLNLGQHAVARQTMDEALQLSIKVNGPQHEETAGLYNNFGVLLQQSGEYAAARDAFEKTLAAQRQLFGPNHPKYADTQSNLGYLFFITGDNESARQLLELSLATFERTTGLESRGAIRAMNNLANVWDELKQPAKAEPLFARALAAHRKLVGPEHPDNAVILRNLGTRAKEQQQPEVARKYYDQALALCRKGLGNDHLRTADIRLSLGTLLIEQQKFAEASAFVQEAHAAYEKNFGPDYVSLGTSHQLLAQIAAGQKQDSTALEHWDLARRIYRKHNQQILPALSALEQLRFLENIYQLKWFRSLEFAYARRDDPKIVNRALNWVINGKAVAHESLAMRQLLARDTSDPQLASLVGKLSAAQQRLASLALLTPEAAQVAKHRADYTEALETEQQLARQLAQATGRHSTTAGWIEQDELRQALPAGSLYIDLVRVQEQDPVTQQPTNPRYVAWIVPSAAARPVQLIELGSAEKIEAATERVRTALAASGSKDGPLKQQGEAAATELLDRDLRAVSDLVLAPLLPHLDGVKQLILSPDGLLWVLPWAALPVDKQQCLLERCAVRYVLSGRDLVPRSPTKLAVGAPVIFANPDYDAVLPMPGQAPSSNTKRQTYLPRVRPLPFTALEAAAARPILEQLAGKAPQDFEDRAALEQDAKRVVRPQHLLFATHGFFLDKARTNNAATSPLVNVTEQLGSDNPLLRCGLLLAGCNTTRAAEADDGVLTGMEIVGMDLRGTELVVLSACETGIGKVSNGEGVAGLRQSFQLAGAQSVVSTLWQVPDFQSALIMQDFFTNLAAGQSKAEALRNAQLKRIAARKEKSGAAHPFFWAAWTLTGE